MYSISERLSRPYGNAYILAIGIDSYEYHTPLRNAVKDTEAIVEVLTKRYQFKAENVVWLLNGNATRSKILAVLGHYIKTLTQKDTLLIYYAGHGAYNPYLERGSWVPVDGKRNDDTTFVSRTDILERLDKINSRHILVVSDSCFSGTLHRGVDTEMHSGVGEQDQLNVDRSAGLDTSTDDDNYLTSVEGYASRFMMTSGRNKEVPDESVFFKCLIQFLGTNMRPAIGASQVFHNIKNCAPQKGWEPPRYDSLRVSGHEGGEFVFRYNGAPPLMEDYGPKAGPMPTRFVLKPWAWRVAIVAVFTLLLVLAIKLSRHENAPAPEEATQPKPENGIDTTAQKTTWTRTNTPPKQAKDKNKDKPDNSSSEKTVTPNVSDTIRKETKPKDSTRVDPIKPPLKKCKIYVDTKNIAKANVTVWIPEINSSKNSHGEDTVSFWILEDFKGILNIHFTKDDVKDSIQCSFKCGTSPCYSITSKIKH